MKKLMTKLILILVLTTFMVGCSQDKTVSIKRETNINKVLKTDYFENKTKEELNNNLYMITTNKKQYIVFYRMNIDPDTVILTIKDLDIEISTTSSLIYDDILIYEIVNYRQIKDDSTLNVLIDGVSISFDTIII
ncbi:MAG: hypothetical protein GX769_02460 [Erysipelothrix sp.]|nr:hypothetical protein [Erysipelothrix sp.]